MALITVERISSHLVDVSPEQIGCCHAIFGPDGKKFYLVENSKGLFDEENHLIEYAVRYSRERGFTCTCPSGRFGFANVKHPSGVCWHVRASVAAAIEEREALHGLVVATAKADAPVEVLIVEQTATADRVPRWMLEGPVASHMKHAPKERH